MERIWKALAPAALEHPSPAWQSCSSAAREHWPHPEQRLQQQETGIVWGEKISPLSITPCLL